jgi:hypothetical protein
MELRVVVIALISLAIVGSSVLMQRASTRNTDSIDEFVNLLDTANRSDSLHDLFSVDPRSRFDAYLDPELPPVPAGSKASPGTTETPSEPSPQEDDDSLEPFILESTRRFDMNSPFPIAVQSGGGDKQIPLMSEGPASTVKSPGLEDAMLAVDQDQEPLVTALAAKASTDDALAPTNPLIAQVAATSEATVEGAASSMPMPEAEPMPPSPPMPKIPAMSSEAHSAVAVPSTGTPAAPTSAPASRQPIPASVEKIARNHLDYGNTLARRGSLFSAREEFFNGLRLIAESLDLANGVTTHREHFDRATAALSEADDFIGASSRDGATPVPQIIGMHRSKVVSAAEAAQLTPMSAMQAYYAFAEQHLAAACAQTPAASHLMFGLGKLHMVKASQDVRGQPIDWPIAILMFRAALAVDPTNYLSANELGVSLAKMGHLAPARDALLQSLRSQQTPEAWLNLSVVHRQLGETHLADLALTESRKATDRATADNGQTPIQWMDPNAFSNQRRPGELAGLDSDPRPIARAAETEPIATPAGGGLWQKLRGAW